LKLSTAIGLIGLIFFVALASGTASAEESSGRSFGGHESSSGKESSDGRESSSSKPSTVPTSSPSLSASISPAVPSAGAGSDLRARLVDNRPLPTSVKDQVISAPVMSNDQARQAIGQGRAVSMSLLLAFLENNQAGRVLDVKLRDSPQGLVYEVKTLANLIILRSLYLDAATLKPL